MKKPKGATRELLVKYPGELRVNLWEYIGIVVPQKGYRIPTLLLRYWAVVW